MLRVGLLDKIGNVALNALDTAARYAETVRERRAAAEAPPPEPEPTPAPPPAPSPHEIGDKSIPVQVFGRMSCPFTQRALRLLENRDIEHVYTELAQPGGYALAPRLMAATGQRSVPYVYVRGQFVGGFDGLDEIERLGQLDELIKSDEERAASGGPKRTRIQIAPRDRDT